MSDIQNVLRVLPEGAADRKAAPMLTGLLDYFPLALVEVARISKAGNDQHNPGEPLHWARFKSRDHGDCAVRHLIERGTKDTDGQLHTAKAAWRILALLQEELEVAAGWAPADKVADEFWEQGLRLANEAKARLANDAVLAGLPKNTTLLATRTTPTVEQKLRVSHAQALREGLRALESRGLLDSQRATLGKVYDNPCDH